MSKFQTEQEHFWEGQFGDEYTDRDHNRGEELLTKNVFFWGKVLSRIPKINSILELGCNIGMNLRALNKINPNFHLVGYEINKKAAEECEKTNIARVQNSSILEPILEEVSFDLTIAKGVLIHINPESLNKVYENLYNMTSKYILVADYYNPSPVMVEYRGHKDRLFKRDFAGELIDKYDLKLIDYGFEYHRDNYFPQDDFNWFLLEKK